MDRLQDGIFGHHFVSRAHEMLKNSSSAKGLPLPFLLATEACSCSGTAQFGSSLSWIRSQRYAHDILNVIQPLVLLANLKYIFMF
jgi:hypothetical protein